MLMVLSSLANKPKLETTKSSIITAPGTYASHKIFIFIDWRYEAVATTRLLSVKTGANKIVKQVRCLNPI